MPDVVTVDPNRPEAAVIERARAVLARGGLVGMPTETVYGLAARGLHADDVARIFAAKGRPPTHPLILHVADAAMARRVASELSPATVRMMQAFWPGPLTLVVPRGEAVPGAVSGGLPTVAVRAPRHPVARALIAAIDEPLAAPSANAHTHVSPTTAAHVVQSLGDAVDLVLDAGPCAHGIESTVLDLTTEPARVLRPGAVGLPALRAVDASILDATATLTTDEARPSPGLASKHYAPRVDLRVVPTSRVAAEVGAAARGARVAALVYSGEAKSALAALAGRNVRLVEMSPIADEYARTLFAALYDVERAADEVAVVEAVPEEPAFWAVADRLRRASRA